ncbi:MAG: thioesterase family protein, partial [Thermoleophilaceae bacterium]
WDPDAQHAGPPAALLARAVERCAPRDGMRVGRITCEILGPVPLEPLTVEARVARPGRSVEMVEASLAGPGGELMRARAWRLQAGELALQLDEEPRPPGPETGTPSDFPGTSHHFGYHDATDYSFVSGGFRKPGPATVWMRMRVPLVEGEETGPLERVLLAADSGNGVSAALDWRTHLFINTELSVHLMRPLAGEWVCLDAVTRVHGLGLTETILWDERGRLGRAAQTLLVRQGRIGED